MADQDYTATSPEAVAILVASGLSPVAKDAPVTDEAGKPGAEADAAAEKAPVIEGAEAAGDKTAETPSEPEKPAKPTFQERMNEKTRLQREAERERDALKAEIDALKANGNVDPAAIDALVDKRMAEREQARAAAQAKEALDAKMAKAAETRDDFFEKVVEGADKQAWACTNDMFAAISESDVSGDIFYHLATNPDESRRIAALPPHSQIREIVKLEAKLSAEPHPAPPPPPPAETGKPAQPAKTVTSAPVPPPPARQAGGAFKVSADTDDFAAFDAQYKIKR